jgi:hypothetical protein
MTKRLFYMPDSSWFGDKNSGPGQSYTQFSILHACLLMHPMHACQRRYTCFQCIWRPHHLKVYVGLSQWLQLLVVCLTCYAYYVIMAGSKWEGGPWPTLIKQVTHPIILLAHLIISLSHISRECSLDIVTHMSEYSGRLCLCWSLKQ